MTLQATIPPQLIPYNPGPLPTKPAPVAGDRMRIQVRGLPPYKETSKSIRNVNHPRYSSFVALRDAAIRAMDGRAWYFGALSLDLEIHAPQLDDGKRLNDYMAGVEDTIDGSSGFSFTYLPIVMEDDCQVCQWSGRYVEDTNTEYTLSVEFL